MAFLFQTLAGMKTYLAFILHLVALVLLFVLGHTRDADVAGYMIGVLVSYMGGRTIAQTSAHWAASKDSTADTAKVIQDVNEK